MGTRSSPSITTTPVGVSNNTLMTGVPFSRTHQWARVVEAYRHQDPELGAALEQAAGLDGKAKKVSTKYFRAVQPPAPLRVKALLEVTAGAHENENGDEVISFNYNHPRWGVQ